ncbi:ATP-binding protein [Halorarius halobius]|uniref:ATP-binding protein n=1 Tax=Halorarius halobius TaxID=2962671 RepID=UPI0020CD77B5|nr:ATP-binding protein [Halorarius halobius]
MFTFCPDCSATRRDVSVDHDAGTVTCPACGATRQYESQPLLVVTGASAVGKTTAYREVVGTVDAVVVESDLYWLEPRGDVATAWRSVPDESRHGFHLLRYASLGQSGRPVVAFGSALGDAERTESLAEADYFPCIEYLALVCDPDEQARRIRARPGWDGAADSGEPWADVDAQTAANERFRRLADDRADYDSFDNTDATVDETVTAVGDWIRRRL